MANVKPQEKYRKSSSSGMNVYSLYTLIAAPSPLPLPPSSQQERKDQYNNGEVARAKLPPPYFGEEVELNELLHAGAESMSSMDNHVFVGTSNGGLLHLTTVTGEDPGAKPLLRLVKSAVVVSGKKVEEIVIHKKQRKLLVLIDSVIRFYNFDLTPVEGHSIVKGVRAFSLAMGSQDEDSGLLIVARRRCILHFQLARNILMRREIPWPEPIINICTNGTTLCIADRVAYSLVDIRTGQTYRLFCTPFSQLRSNPSTLKPSIVPIDDDEFLVTSPAGEHGAIGMFVSSIGDAVRGTITWKSYPQKVVFEFPFTIALTIGSIEIHNIMTQTLVQTIPVGGVVLNLADNAGLWRNVPELDAQLNTGLSDDMAISTIPSQVMLCGHSWVGCLSLESVLLQVNHLLESSQAEAAIMAAEDASAMVSEQSPHFSRMARELRHAYQKCGLFFLSQTLLEDSLLLLQRGRLDPRVLIAFFPELRDSSSFSYADYLQAQKVFLDPGVLKFAIGMNSVQDIVKRSIFQPQEHSPVLESATAELVSNMTDMLKKYLIEFKSRTFGNDDQLKATDTALVKLLSRDDSPAIASILASENLCDLESCLSFFRDQKNVYAESLIYKAQGRAQETFKIWMEIYEAGNPVITLDAIADYLVIQNDLGLVLGVAQWLANEDPETAAKAFARLPDSVFDRLGHTKMLDMLQAKGAQKANVGITLFLEKLVFERTNKDPHVHLKLAKSYLASFSFGQRSSSHQSQLEQMDHSFLVARTIRPQSTYLDFLNVRNDRISLLRKKLISFLTHSSYFPLRDMMALLENGPPLLLERAIVCSKLCLHRRALELLVQLQDYSGAERYCIRGGSFVAPLPEDSSLFKLLLDVYLAGEDEHAMIEQVESLLRIHYHRFQALEVLELLPTHWSADVFAPFFIAHLKSLTCQRLDLQILKSIFISENIQVNSQLASTRISATPLVILPTTTCDNCRAPIGTSEVVFSSGKPRGIFHSSCWASTQTSSR